MTPVPRGRRALITGLSVIAVLGVVVGVSVVWPGLDAREVPPAETSLWALQTGDGRRYARVNTAVGELDTVRNVGNPSALAQSPAGAFLFSESFGRVTRLDEAQPADVVDDVLRESPATPAGTTDVAVAGDFVAYRTDTGAVWTGALGDPSPAQVAPDGADAPDYTAAAIAVDDGGMLYAYSAERGEVLRYDIAAGQARGRDPLDADAEDPALTAASGAWFLLDRSSGGAWQRGADAGATTDVDATAVVSVPSSVDDAVYIADQSRLLRWEVGAAQPEIVAGGVDEVRGTPARPVTVAGVTYAAWLPETGGGTLWSSAAGENALDFAGRDLGDQRRPVFLVSGGTAALNETRSGWVWEVPGGRLVPTSQDWTLDDRQDPTADDSLEQAAVVLDPRPPVAEADAFGLRQGALSVVPVLLNDHDPNEDVLSIDPASVTGLDPGFGEVTITDNGQRLAVRAAPGASGTATLTYRVTDGTASEGMFSEPATVTLTIVPAGANSAPQWCGVPECLHEWPAPEVAAGGTVSVPVLTGWVDPEGDPLLLLSVTNPSGVGVVASTPAGEVVYQHADDGTGAAGTVDLVVTVADALGAVSSRPLSIRVSEQPGLAADSFALVDSGANAVTVDVGPHVVGTAGRVELTAVRVLDDAAATAVVSPGGTVFDFSAAGPGTYRLAYTVSDGAREATATVRITLVAEDAPAQLTTAPVVAFVHPREDATVDVFAAVSNPTRRVLLLSDVRARAAPGSSLSVDAVGQNFLRVSGATASGEAGLLGTVSYTVGDGTADDGAQVAGEATVYLLPPAPELAPIAVDDTVVVRAGAQVDIPVLDNDVAPSGSAVNLNPAQVVSSTPDALAFGSGSTLRYLAPPDPGEYTVEYGVYSAASPALADTASVRVRVMPEDANRAPVPATLEGRVVSGQTTTIAFDGFGVDPDGDAVLLDQVVSQPASGSATVSPDGTSIVYSSVPGHRGQVSFRYRVVDGLGSTGTGTVRIGVLDAQTDPAPVTFTDYVHVQAGEGNTVRISPLDNDVDPSRGTLRLTGIQPDVSATLDDGSANPEYARQRELIRELDDTSVLVAAGDARGTLSFLYDVESDSGNTARGRIVVRVVREAVPNYPTVADTTLTVESRDDFPSGVDVVSGKASWIGGDVADLSLSLWGDPEGVRVTGNRLAGALPEESRVVAFELSGDAADGPVSTFGFLRIPGEADLVPAVRSSAPAWEVMEGESGAVDLTRVIAVPRGAGLEVSEAVSASGARPGSACALESGTRLRYDAGYGAPWMDACEVPVRVGGAQEWTYLSLPVTIRAAAPQPALRTGSLTLAPGESTTFDLRSLTTWQGTEDWDGVAYGVAYAGAAFEVLDEGGVLTVTGRDDAVPGVQEAVEISITSHAGVAPARLLLRVGPAPSLLPRAGAVAQVCSQAAGTSCTIDVVAAAGEVNPLPRTPMELVGVRAAGACTGVTFEVASPRAVIARWTADAAGATCPAVFSLRDAQGRVTAGERDGSLLLDLQGFPRAPGGVVQTGYGDGTLTLRVDPGEARSAYPALTGFTVRTGGSVVATCDPLGVCGPIPAPNGEERGYEVTSTNAVGESRGVVRTVAWAYDPPGPPGRVTAQPVVTGGEGGVVALGIEGVDSADTGWLEIASESGETLRVDVPRGRETIDVASYRVGSNTASPIVVTPHSRYAVPPGLPGETTGPSLTIFGNGVGAPRDVALTLAATSLGDGTSRIRAEASAGSGGDGSRLVYGIVAAGQRCVPQAQGSVAEFGPVADGQEYGYTVCVQSRVGERVFGEANASATVRALQSGRPPEGWTYVVSPAPEVSQEGASWIIRDAPASAEQPPRNNSVEIQGGPPSSVFDRNPGIRVRYVHRQWGTATDWALALPREGSAPYQVWARWRVDVCEGGQPLALRGDSSNDPAGGRASIVFDRGGAVFRDASGAVLPFDAGTGIVPVGAVSVEGIRVTADWAAQGWGLQPATGAFGSACSPNLPPPDPVPPADGEAP
ncbi:Ig-like domain-containing protein [Microbacterium limosum]|uniref:Ig-like domain-containing protein n=1 Tax=Microbacterium limosum TaxID=3079935 RepID=A0AAU0MGP1_9MICO|nr:Ig-like domain-containing protein [Microbacterium sp. Y20]WOQ69325.1 Ig-like domain-containing protein [Microbacterium sp. Y20]